MAGKTTNTTMCGKSPEPRQADARHCWRSCWTRWPRWPTRAQWLAYLEFVSAFRRDRFNNLLLIAAQCPHATRVAGYRKWQEAGRQVRKGERAFLLGRVAQDLDRLVCARCHLGVRAQLSSAWRICAVGWRVPIRAGMAVSRLVIRQVPRTSRASHQLGASL